MHWAAFAECKSNWEAAAAKFEAQTAVGREKMAEILSSPNRRNFLVPHEFLDCYFLDIKITVQRNARRVDNLKHVFLAVSAILRCTRSDRKPKR